MELKEFAYLGSNESYQKMIDYLTTITEEETWTNNDSQPNGILKNYIKGTFKRCYEQSKILYSSDGEWCCINTGLLTPNGNDILMLFQKNKRQGTFDWILKSFQDKTERTYMDIFDTIPDLATYTQNFELFYFNPQYPIVVSTDHILDDNWDRIKEVVPLSKPVVKSLMLGVIEEAKRKIKRNLRLVVPQFYNNQIMYLMPIQIPIDDNKIVTMALAVELTSTKQYRANTIFTKEMAYEKARLLMKPESNWLL